MKKYIYIALTVFTASLIFGLGDITTGQSSITLEDLDPSSNRIQIPEYIVTKLEDSAFY